MTKPRVLLNPGEVNGARIVIEGERAHYLVRVLRLGPGDGFEAASPEGVVLLAEITAIGEGHVEARVLGGEVATADPVRHLELALAVLKGRAMDVAVAKTTEVGLAALTPILAQRCVVRLDARRRAGRVGRWRQIAAEAARSAQRTRPPQVKEPLTVTELADRCRADAGQWLLLDPEAHDAPSLGERAAADPPAGLIVGPEGDFTPDEKALLQSAGAEPVTLGPRILKADTAAVVACAIVLDRLGELG